jgi:diguanylate cyclase (GGDEF)-like protein
MMVGLLRDELTGLGSLLALRRQLEPIVDRYEPFGPRPALLLIDIDGFGRINTMYDRSVGDHVLACTSARLADLVPGEGATYRTGGDEFVALINPATSIDAIGWAEQLQVALSQPVDADGYGIPLTVSIAVVMLGYRHRVDGLLRDADVAMYRAKCEGGNRVDVYNWEADNWAVARKRLAEQLEKEVEELRLQNRVLTDALTLDLSTGLPNSLAFEADHAQLDAWRRRTNEPYSLLRICVDGIEDAPARFRSPDGIQALAAVAHAVRDTVRQSDRAYVLGDGQLGVLLRGSTTKQAIGAAGRVRAKVHGLALPRPDASPGNVTVTIAAIEAGFRHAAMDDVLREVNDLLRAATSQGGDRIVWPH